MAKQKSIPAQAAAEIRKELKKHGIKARVRSESYSMGSSVNVDINNEPPGVAKRIEAFANQYQQGHFDGMQDLYEYSNSRDDLPQVKFVFVNNNFSDDMFEDAYQWLRDTMADYEDMPESYNDARDMQVWNNNVMQDVYRVLKGVYWNGRDGGFWKAKKPTVRVELEAA